MENEASPSTNNAFQDATSTRARRNCVFVLTEDRSGRDFANWNARERDRIARIEFPFSVCMIAERCRHERECGACGENGRLSDARMKHHLSSVL